MKTTAYRVQRVLRGDSASAAIIAVDAQGREVRLEVGNLEGASVNANDVLVLSWATVQVPGLAMAPSPTTPRVADDEPLPDRPMADDEDLADRSELDDEALRSVEEDLKEITALMGLA